MDQIIVAIEVVSPVFLIIALGYFLRYKKVIDESFIDMAMKVVFKVCLPGLLFIKVSAVDIGQVASGDSLKFILLVVIMTMILFTIAKLYANKFVEEAKRATFIQGSYRSNYVIIGYTILHSLLGDAIITRMALLVIVAVPLYNVLAIWLFSEDQSKSRLQNILTALSKVVTNPLIIAIVLGFIVAALEIRVPIILTSTISKLGACGTPLGLIGIGGYMSFNGLFEDKDAFIATIFKVIIAPLIIVIPAYMMGYSYMDVCILYVLFGSPAAISSFIMASAMNGDSRLAANIVIISTASSLFTYIVGLSTIAMLY